MDNVADMIIALKHAGASSKETVSVPYSNFKLSIGKALLKAGFVNSIDKKVKKSRSVLEIGIAYDEKGRSKISGVKRISKPSRRMYTRIKEIKPVRQGYGIMIISTPKGILTDKEARKEHVGGEVLFSIW